MDIQFDLENPAKKYKTKEVVVGTMTLDNTLGKEDREFKAALSETDEVEDTYEWYWNNAVTVETEAQFKAGIPCIAEGQIKLGVKDTLDFGKKQTSSVRKIKSLVADIPLSAKAGTKAVVDVAIKKYEIEVPFTATFKDGTKESGTFKGVQHADLYVKYK